MFSSWILSLFWSRQDWKCFISVLCLPWCCSQAVPHCFALLQLIYSVSLPRSSSRCFAYLAHCGNLSSWLRPPVPSVWQHTIHTLGSPCFHWCTVFKYALVRLSRLAFHSGLQPSLRLWLTPPWKCRNEWNINYYYHPINIESSRLGARDAADSGGARMNLLMTQSVINDVAALFFIDSHSLRGQPHISEIRPGEGSQSHSLSINWVHNHIAEWCKKTWERSLVVF